MARIWNITDHPGTAHTPRVMMVLGRSIRPGKSINVPDERLAHAKKVQKAVVAKKLAIGSKPPASYLVAKNLTRLEMPAGAKRSHGPKVAEAAKAAEKRVIVLGDKPEVKEEVAAQVKKADDAAEPTTSKSSKGSKKNRRS